MTLLLLGVPYFIVYWLNRRRLGITGVQRIRTNRERYTSVNEAFGGIKDLKLMGRESYYFKKFSSASHLFSNLMISHSLIGSLPRFALETIASVELLFWFFTCFVQEEVQARLFRW